jgi:copper homeostasis protein CutC
MPIVLEVCVDSVRSAIALASLQEVYDESAYMIGVCSAADGGANRLELCANLGAPAALLLRDPVVLTEGLTQA